MLISIWENIGRQSFTKRIAIHSNAWGKFEAVVTFPQLILSLIQKKNPRYRIQLQFLGSLLIRIQAPT